MNTTAPYELAWDTAAVANGAHTLTAAARDAAGHETASAAVSVTVTNDDRADRDDHESGTGAVWRHGDRDGHGRG